MKRVCLCTISFVVMLLGLCGGCDDAREILYLNGPGNVDQLPEGSDNNQNDGAIYEDTLSLVATTMLLEVEAGGGYVEFIIRTNQTYQLINNIDWIEVVNADGRAVTEDHKVSLYVNENLGEAREGVITILYDDKANTEHTVVVRQEASDDPVRNETVTVNLSVHPTSEFTLYDLKMPVEVSEILNVYSLTQALADGIITYAAINPNGAIFTAADGSVPSATTNGPYGHWYNTDYQPCYWATPDPINNNADRFAYIEGDGENFILGFQYYELLVPGEKHTISALYSKDNLHVRVDIVITVNEAPKLQFVAPDPDYVIDVQAVQDNSWGATYISLDGTDVSGFGQYSNPYNWVNPVEDVCLDITDIIEDSFGIAYESLEEKLANGEILLGAYKLDESQKEQVFVNCRYEYTGNSFFWYTTEGAVTGYGDDAYAVLDQFGYTGGTDCQLYGVCVLMPNRAVIGEIYSMYMVFLYNDLEFVVQVNAEVVGIPNKTAFRDADNYDVVASYQRSYTVKNPGAYITTDPVFSIEDIMTDINFQIDGDADILFMSTLDAQQQTEYVEWIVHDGWFGWNGATAWASGEAVFCLKPDPLGGPSYTGFSSYCAAREDGPGEARVTLLYGNSKSLKAVAVEVSVTLE